MNVERDTNQIEQASLHATHDGVGSAHFDVFISHASEDKDSIARPLAVSLRELGFEVWYDEFSLQIGDSLRESIDHGLAQSRHAIVILSPDFFAKRWATSELNGLVNREMIEGTNVLLPIWHKVGRDDVAAVSPILVDRVAGDSAVGVQKLAEQIAAKLGSPLNLDASSKATILGQEPPFVIEPHPKGVLTHQLHSGSEILRMVANTHESLFDVDQAPREHRQLAGDFLQEVQDLPDILDQLGVGDRIAMETRLDEMLEELQSVGLFVWGASYDRGSDAPKGIPNWICTVFVIRDRSEMDPKRDRQDLLQALELQGAFLANLVLISRRRRVDQHAHERLPNLSEDQQKKVDRWFDEDEEAIGRVLQVQEAAQADPEGCDLTATGDALGSAASLVSALCKSIAPELEIEDAIKLLVVSSEG